jgi:uncharacterized protein YkwD
MVCRAWNVALGASLALLAGAALALAGPLTPAASGNACRSHGDTQPTRLSVLHARSAVRCLLNRKRQSHGLSRIRANDRLERAAQRHTRYMTQHGCFSHQCRGERSVLARLMRVSYIVGGLTRWSFGENIAWGAGGSGQPKAIVRSWMRSPGHRANILNPRFDEIGIGFRTGYPRSPKADGGTYTTDFGMRKG